MARIASIEIRDTFGTEYSRFAPKSLTIISGANGKGKSSILRALGSIFEGGNDPSMVRRGCKKATITLALDDGTVIQKTQNAKGSTVEITDKEGRIIPAPMTFIRQLGESWAIDPGKILEIDASTAGGRKALMTALLEIMPLQFHPEEVRAALRAGGREWAEARSVDLLGLDKVRKTIEEDRRRIGVACRDAEGTIKRLQSTLPPEEDRDWAAERSRLSLELDASEKEFHLYMAEVDRQERVAIEQVRLEYEKRREAGRVARKEALEPIIAEQATVSQRADEQQRAKGARETIEKMRREISDQNMEYDRLTTSLTQLEVLKKSKLDALPVPGMEFSEDRVLLDGVEWQNVNKARRARAAIDMLVPRAGALPLIVMDDSEHFDSENMRALKDAALESEFQVMMARVTDGPLRIETVSAGQQPDDTLVERVDKEAPCPE